MYSIFILCGWLGLIPLIVAAGHFANRVHVKSDRAWKWAFYLSLVAVTVYTLFAVIPFLLHLTMGAALAANSPPPPSPSPGGPSITVGGLISFLAVFFVIVPLNFLSLMVLASSPPVSWQPGIRARFRLAGVAGAGLAFVVVVSLFSYARSENRREYQERFRPPPAINP